MKYRDLLEYLSDASEEFLEQDVTIAINEDDPDGVEFFKVEKIGVTTEEQDVLDPGHLYLVF